ncbi:MAG: ATP-dependent Clp protease proteolytic subunit [Aphanocapsa feldmannii 277cV]|uniref:ATP-dependent Clp protease proteolytic subunit n=2 Tax=Aphanocapsa feldmannii TaxID=192050 RepID=A0A524RNI2_9CHRO|nr:MAG: ATP-dependent Clp protease proteolytic subunit [Aphanocapsa feldmannii 288cV]TGG92622.1 MAG: ATP-dependent Clp protease proteolytic subunit [Aphanocapsa feldmannii 277cV]TGH24006.1 MAG: ATP-dependent Clp protease proteolytic subunit [Aphanocapsa feldmannii 277cI]
MFPGSPLAPPAGLTLATVGPGPQAVSAPYGLDGGAMRTPPPDLPSLLLKERIVYMGLPLFSDDDAKRQLGMDVTELIIAQLLYLEFDSPDKPIFFYINSTGTSWYGGDAVGFETEAFAICDTIRYVKPPVHTICIGQAMGSAAMILSAGSKGFRASLPNASIVLHQPRSGTRGQASDIQIRAREVLSNKQTMLRMLAENTGQSLEQINKDSNRMTYMTPEQARAYGLIDRVLTSQKDLPAAVAV